jgi:hypothetical protein
MSNRLGDSKARMGVLLNACQHHRRRGTAVPYTIVSLERWEASTVPAAAQNVFGKDFQMSCGCA